MNNQLRRPHVACSGVPWVEKVDHVLPGTAKALAGLSISIWGLCSCWELNTTVLSPPQIYGFFHPYAASRNLTEAREGAIVALRKLYGTKFA
jgi:hypothetical protein